MRKHPSQHAIRTLIAVAAVAMTTACATTATRPTPATTPTSELMRRFVLDYEHVPPAPPQLSGELRSAWASLRAGDAATARGTLDTVVGASSERDLVEGMLLLSEGATQQAQARFQSVLTASPDEPVALYGLGFAAEAEGDREAGLDWYAQAVDADPMLSAAAVRLRVLQLERAQALLARGEQAEESGDRAAALDAYESAQELAPDVLESYLRIAALQRAAGNSEEAVRTLRDARDRIGELRVILEPLGEALQETGAEADAYDVYQALQEIAPGDPDVRARVAQARERYFTTSLPEPYRALEDKDEILREDLAALIAIRLEELADLVEEPQVGTIINDIEDSWARDYIREVVQWGVMEVFQNHVFEPELVMKRMYFAEIAYRVLELIGATDGISQSRLTDMPSDHFLYDEVHAVVGLGVLEADSRGRFGLLDPVSGAEAVAAVQRLVRIARSRSGR